jgi:hypothetical protein
MGTAAPAGMAATLDDNTPALGPRRSCVVAPLPSQSAPEAKTVKKALWSTTPTVLLYGCLQRCCKALRGNSDKGWLSESTCTHERRCATVVEGRLAAHGTRV